MKFAGWLSKILIGTVLMTIISIFTTWYIVNLYMQDVMKQFHIQTSSKSFDFGDFLGTAVTQTGGLSSPAPQADESARVLVPDKDAAPVWNQNGISQSGRQDSQSGGDLSVKRQSEGMVSGEEQIVFSIEEFNKKKEQMSNEDKMQLFSLLITRLPQQEMQKISLYVENGITNEELKEVNDIVQKYLKPNEYEELMNILNKYLHALK